MSYKDGYLAGYEDGARDSKLAADDYNGWVYEPESDVSLPSFNKIVNGRELKVYSVTWMPIDDANEQIARFVESSSPSRIVYEGGNPDVGLRGYGADKRGPHAGEEYILKPKDWSAKMDGERVFFTSSQEKTFDRITKVLEELAEGATIAREYDSFYDMFVDEGYDRADYNAEFSAGLVDLGEADMPTNYAEAENMAAGALAIVEEAIYDNGLEGEEAEATLADAKAEHDRFLQLAQEFFG